MRSRRGAFWTGWWVIKFRRCCGIRCGGGYRRGGGRRGAFRGLSAGRVQTVALRLIVDREREIRAFQKREYWTIDVNLGAKKPPTLVAHLAKRDAENVEIADEAGAKAIG